MTLTPVHYGLPWSRSSIRYACVCAIGFVLVLLLVLQADVEDDPASFSRRVLQFGSTNTWSRFAGSSPSPVTSVVETVFPFYRPNQYPLQPVSSFFRFPACTDINRPGCDSSNTIVFTTAVNPPPNGFRYHNTGPPELQGVFWTQQDELASLFGPLVGLSPDDPIFVSTELVSFARTRHGGGVQEGVLRTNEDGYEYVARPVGDHSWSTSQRAPDTYLSGTDVLYQFDLTEGTLTSPRRFEIVISFKVWFDCLRYNFGRLASGEFRLLLVDDHVLNLRVETFLRPLLCLISHTLSPLSFSNHQSRAVSRYGSKQRVSSPVPRVRGVDSADHVRELDHVGLPHRPGR